MTDNHEVLGSDHNLALPSFEGKTAGESSGGEFETPKVALVRGYTPSQRAALTSKGLAGVHRHINPKTLGTLGGAAGAIKGLVAPGEEEVRDEEGRVVGTKSKGRLGAALKGGLAGSAVGTAAGMAGRSVGKRYAQNIVKDTPKSQMAQMRQEAGSPNMADKFKAMFGKGKPQGTAQYHATPEHQPADKGAFGKMFKPPEVPGNPALEPKTGVNPQPQPKQQDETQTLRQGR